MLCFQPTVRIFHAGRKEILVYELCVRHGRTIEVSECGSYPRHIAIQRACLTIVISGEEFFVSRSHPFHGKKDDPSALAANPCVQPAYHSASDARVKLAFTHLERWNVPETKPIKTAMTGLRVPLHAPERIHPLANRANGQCEVVHTRCILHPMSKLLQVYRTYGIQPAARSLRPAPHEWLQVPCERVRLAPRYSMLQIHIQSITISDHKAAFLGASPLPFAANGRSCALHFPRHI